ncbi:MAG: CoA transferase, partial [Proteobacteria bacterium]|nr:CoA transferase [Pseudomonadota bacterium]
SMQGLNYLTSGVAPPRYGNAHPNIVPYQVFATADGHIILAIANDGQFDRFCQYTDAAELCRDERFSTNAERVRNREALIPKLAEIIAAKPSRHWLDGLEACNVSCGPINTIDQVFNDPHVRARGMEIAMAHPLSEKPVRLIGSPLKMSATPPSYDHPPPLLGQHTEALLGELLGLSGDDIAGLRGRGVI